MMFVCVSQILSIKIMDDVISDITVSVVSGLEMKSVTQTRNRLFKVLGIY